MDSKKECKIPKCSGFWAEGEPLAVGARQLRRAVKAGKIRLCVLAADADPAVTEPLEALCREHSVPVQWAQSMAALGRACGIDVGAAAAGVLLREDG